jgi:SAM-dependent methyltransferase
MASFKRISNIMKYGLGEQARTKKRAAKGEARKSAFESERWNRQGSLVQRNYNSYDEYVTHQAGKLDKVAHRLRETEDDDFTDFKRRFEGCTLLAEARYVLCLGARLGTEVRALHALGYFAIGIDLNPGLNNPYVLPGDFHKLVFPDRSVDAIYTNALDHVFDLEKVVAEVRRLLRPAGLFVVDMLPGFEEGFVPGAFEATHWRDASTLIERVQELGGFLVEEQRDLGQIRRDRWMQVVFRTPT